MIDDTRAAVWTVSSETLLDAFRSVGIGSSGYPKFLYYEVPGVTVRRQRNVLLKKEELPILTGSQRKDIYVGSNVLTSVNAGGEIVVVDGELLRAASLEYTDYPSLGTYQPLQPRSSGNSGRSVIGYLANGVPIISRAYKAREVKETFTTTLNEAQNLQSASGSIQGNTFISSVSVSNIREIEDANGTKIYADVTLSTAELN